MIEGSNVVVLSGGITKDPEVISGKVVKFSVAVDYAANDKGGNSTGYFDVTYFLDDANRNSTFVKSQISDGKMKKGSQVSLVGRLVQERWTSDEGNRSKVTVIAESISYVKGGAPRTADTGASDGTAAANIPEF